MEAADPAGVDLDQPLGQKIGRRMFAEVQTILLGLGLSRRRGSRLRKTRQS